MKKLIFAFTAMLFILLGKAADAQSHDYTYTFNVFVYEPSGPMSFCTQSGILHAEAHFNGHIQPPQGANGNGDLVYYGTYNKDGYVHPVHFDFYLDDGLFTVFVETNITPHPDIPNYGECYGYASKSFTNAHNWTSPMPVNLYLSPEWELPNATEPGPPNPN